MLKETAAAWDEQHIKMDSHVQTDQRQLPGYFSQFNIKKKKIAAYSLAAVNMLKNWSINLWNQLEKIMEYINY
jgi:hypothetical protein